MPLFKPKSKQGPKTEASKNTDLSMAVNVQRAAKRKKMAQGGEVSFGHEVADNGGPGREMAKLRKNPDPMLMSEGGSVSEKIMAKRSKSLDFNEDNGGLTTNTYDMRDEDAIKKENYADGGMVDLNEESEEHPNEYYELNAQAANEEQYDDSQLDPQPRDSNLKGHELEDKHDMIAAIRRKLSAKRGM